VIGDTLYKLDAQVGAQYELIGLLRGSADSMQRQLESPDDDSAPLSERQLLASLGTVTTAYLAAIDRTPETTLRRLEARATRRLLAGGLVLIDWAAILAAVVFGILAAVNQDGRTVLAWGGLLVAGLLANRLLVHLPLCPEAEREQLRVLLAWRAGKACPECNHGPHLPGCCPWGATEYNSAAAHGADADVFCECGEEVPL
jgi:hypothetical protein